MTKTIDVTFDPAAITLDIAQPDEDIQTGELVEWIFHDVPDRFAPAILFKTIKEADSGIGRYYGPFTAITQETQGIDGGQKRVWGVAAFPDARDFEYRAVIEAGVGEDPFEEPYGNSPDSVGKAIVISTEGVLHKQAGLMTETQLDEHARHILDLAAGPPPLPGLNDSVKVIPITQTKNDQGQEELVIHDDFLWVTRANQVDDLVVFDFKLVPQNLGWFPMVDFIGGEGMEYEDIKCMHFGPFKSLTTTISHIIGSGKGLVPGAYHYRVAMINVANNSTEFKSSPDPVVEYPEPGDSGGGG